MSIQELLPVRGRFNGAYDFTCAHSLANLGGCGFNICSASFNEVKNMEQKVRKEEKLIKGKKIKP